MLDKEQFKVSHLIQDGWLGWRYAGSGKMAFDAALSSGAFQLGHLGNAARGLQLSLDRESFPPEIAFHHRYSCLICLAWEGSIMHGWRA